MSKIHSVTVELKVLTSMFTYGDKNNCEFRLTELKSLMRTIFREFFEFEDLKDMKEKEGKIFGSLGGKAPVSFKMVEDGKTSSCMLIHHKGNGADAIKENEKISFKMISWDKEILDLYCQILLLSSVFGSIGKRARKGLGSFRIDKIDGFSIENPLEILNFYNNKNINGYKFNKFEETKIKNNSSIFKLTSINNLDFPYVKEIKIIKLKKEIDDSLLKNISQLTHNRLLDSFIEKIEKSDKKYLIDKDILGSGSNRFSSPLWITFWKDSNNNKYMIIKVLNYEYKLLKNNENDIFINNYIYKDISTKEFKELNFNNKRTKKEELKKNAQQKFKSLSILDKNKVSKELTLNYINEYLKEITKIGGEK